MGKTRQTGNIVSDGLVSVDIDNDLFKVGTGVTIGGQSGIATVGFSTHFLFPSGSAPTLPTANGSISLISFTVHRGGSTGISTQLLSGASLNYS